MVRAKFKVISKTETNYSYWKNVDGVNQSVECILFTFKFSPVYSPDLNHENHKFWEATPSGIIELGSILNKEASDQFHIGKEYYIDFTQADEVK